MIFSVPFWLRRFLIVPLGLAVLLTAACAQKSMHQSPATDKQAAELAVSDHLGPLDESPRKPGQQPLRATFLDVSGAYRHGGTGLTFPETAAGFTRDSVMRFGKGDGDIGATYAVTGTAGIMRAAVYIYPWDNGNSVNKPGSSDEIKACRETFLAAAQATALGFGQRGFHNPKMRDLGRVQAAFNNEAGGYAAEFDLHRSSGDGQSLLYLQCGVERKWLVKYRFLYARGVDGPAQAAAFMAAVPGR